MTFFIEYDGRGTYWVMARNGETICGHQTLREAERTYYLLYPEQYRPKWVKELAG